MRPSNPTFYNPKKGTKALNPCLEGLNREDGAPKNRCAYSLQGQRMLHTDSPFLYRRDTVQQNCNQKKLIPIFFF